MHDTSGAVVQKPLIGF